MPKEVLTGKDLESGVLNVPIGNKPNSFLLEFIIGLRCKIV